MILYGFLIFMIVLIIFYSNYATSSIHNQLISGFYEANNDFCDEAGIDMFCLYFDDDISFTGNRACYILAKRDDEMVLNEPVSAKITQRMSWSSSMSEPKYFDVDFIDLDESLEDVFPRKQTMIFYPMIGKIILHANDTITAALYKNGVNSEIKMILNEKNKENGATDDIDEE